MRELSASQKEYIDKNLGKKAERRIARDLGLNRSVISGYIQALRSGKTGKPGIASRIPPKIMTLIHVALVFGIALLVRLVYIHQLNHSYFFAPFTGGYDDQIFDKWAQEIIKGNWLGDGLIFIYRMPLYVYFLSIVYSLFGHTYAAVYIIQSLLGAATCVIVYAIGRMLFNRNTGLLAGLIVALYGPILFYNGMLVGEVLGMFITSLAFLSLVYFQETGRYRHLFASGILIGLSMLLRGNMLIVLPFIFVWLFLLFRKESAWKPLRYIAVLCVAILIAISPIIIRNYIARKGFVPITALGGFNVYIGNAHGADGTYRRIPEIGSNPEDMIKNSIKIAEKEAGRPLRASEVSNFWVRQTLKSISKDGVGPFLLLLAKKFAIFWNMYEVPDIWDYYFFKQFIPILALPFFSFLILAPLAFVGAYMSWPRRKELSLLYTFIIGYMFSLVAIFITSRYRIQVAPFLAILAAYAIVGIPEVFRNNLARAIACVTIFLAGVVFVCLPVTKHVDFETSYNSLGIVLKKQGNFEDAIKMYTNAIRIAPGYPSPYYNLGLLYRDTGRPGLAKEYLNKALQADPNFTRAAEELRQLRTQQ